MSQLERRGKRTRGRRTADASPPVAPVATAFEASTPALDAHRLKRGWAELPLRRAFETDDPVLRVVLERAGAGSRPGVRRVPRRRGRSDVRRLARGEPAVNLELLFDELLDRRRPSRRKDSPAAPTSARSPCRSARVSFGVLADLRDRDTALSAVRASSSVPLLTGGTHQFRGEPLVDGGFLESVPYRAALREGATHVLVLRSCHAGHRLPQYRRATGLAMRIADPTVASLLRARPERYNEEADELERLALHPCGRPFVTQVTVPRELRLVGRVDTDVTQIRACVRLGMRAVASLVVDRGSRPLAVAA